MHYLRNGRTIPGFESEDVISADAPIDVDIEQLSADLENAQATILEESNKYNSALEAMDELENTIGDIEVAMESDVDLVTAQLLVNSLNKHSNVLYGKDLQSAGLQSDSPRNILEAGLLDGKGMVNAVKEFIAKVWQKIKNAFSYVWNKMKDFWAWLTGSNKKVEEKLEETIVAAATVQAAENVKEDIKKAEEDIKANRNASDYAKRYMKRKETIKKFKEDEQFKKDNDIKTPITGGKFSGKNVEDLNLDELIEFMEEKNNTQAQIAIIDDVIDAIIIEETSKTLGNLPEEKEIKIIEAAKMITSKGKTIMFAYDPKFSKRIVEIINKNIETNKDALVNTILKVLFLSVTKSGIKSGFAYSPISVFEDYAKYKETTNDFHTSSYDIKQDISVWTDVSIANMLEEGLKTDNIVGSAVTIKSAVDCSINAINNLNNILNSHWKKDDTKEIENKINTGPLAFVFSAPTINGNKLSASYFNVFEKGIMEFDNVNTAGIARFKMDNDILKSITKINLSSLAKRKSFPGLENLQQNLTHLVKFADDALHTTEKNVVANADDKNWRKVQGNLIKLINNVSFFNPVIIINTAKENNAMLMEVLNAIDIKGAISQAMKEGK